MSQSTFLQPTMTDDTSHPAIERAGITISHIASFALPYGLAIIFLWFGGMKFTSYEAQGIAPFIANSPLVSWWHKLLGIQGASYLLAMFEIATGLLLAARAFSPKLSAIGGVMGIITFLVTLSLMFSTPGVAEPLAGGFPALSAMPGQFLLKDVGLLSISFWVLGDSLVASARLAGGDSLRPKGAR